MGRISIPSFKVLLQPWRLRSIARERKKHGQDRELRNRFTQTSPTIFDKYAKVIQQKKMSFSINIAGAIGSLQAEKKGSQPKPNKLHKN